MGHGNIILSVQTKPSKARSTWAATGSLTTKAADRLFRRPVATRKLPSPACHSPARHGVTRQTVRYLGTWAWGAEGRKEGREEKERERGNQPVPLRITLAEHFSPPHLPLALLASCMAWPFAVPIYVYAVPRPAHARVSCSMACELPDRNLR